MNHPTISLNQDHPKAGLRRGDRGTVVHHYEDGKTIEVEIEDTSTMPTVITLTTDDVTFDLEPIPVKKVAQDKSPQP